MHIVKQNALNLKVFVYNVSFIIFQLLDVVSPKPRGVAVFSGGRGGEGKVATVSDQWGVLSPTTKVLI
ncbi:UNVERIFIED_CONTAM: hypothetical protein NCL1_33134 [Trichonephila clavipes]